MKKRRCWRYTCDHCKKSGASGSAISRHEARCFCNPARVCPVCEDNQVPLAELLPLFEGATQETVQEFVNKVERAAMTCPACTVAAIRQSPHLDIVHSWEDAGGQEHETPGRIWITYDYKTKAAEYIREKLAERHADGWPC